MNTFVFALFALTNFLAVPEKADCDFEKFVQNLGLRPTTKKDSYGFYYVLQDKKYKGRPIPVKMKNCHIRGLTRDNNLILATFNKLVSTEAIASGIQTTSFYYIPTFVVLYVPEIFPQEFKEKLQSTISQISFEGTLELSTHSSMALFTPEAPPRSVMTIGFLYVGVTPKVVNDRRVPRK